MTNEKSGMYKNILEQAEVITRLVKNYDEVIGSFAAQVLAHEKLFLVGTGASLNGALSSIPAFAKLANRVPMVIPASEIGYYTHLFDDNSAVVLISQSGDSFETKLMCDIMRQKGLPFWGITNEANSTLAQKATQVLFMNAGKEVSSATKTETATLLLLYMVAAYGSPTAEKELQKLPQAVELTLKNSREAALHLAKLLCGTKVMYVLGDNISGATARQGALMLKEKDFIRAEGMTASEYRHGAVEVSSEGLEILMLASSESNYDEMAKHAAFLLSIGCSVSLIAPKPIPGIAQERYIPIEAAGEDVFSHLSTTIPLQYLAEEIATLNGYDVDGFRFLSKVVETY